MHMQYYALCSRSRFRNVHLLLDDIAVVAAEGAERCLGGLQMHIELHCAFQNYITVISSKEIHTNNSVVFINWIMKKQTRVEDQKLKINLEWPNGTI